MMKLEIPRRPTATMYLGQRVVPLPRLHKNVRNEAKFSENRYLPTVQRARTTPAIVPA